MATTQPGSGPDLVRDAHDHPIVATQLWAAYVAGVTKLAHDTLARREREAERTQDATTDARGTLGGH